MCPMFSLWLSFCAVSFWSSIRLAAADADVCAICAEPIVDIYYNFEDQVTLEKMHVCKNCEQSFPLCFVCGLPANTNAAGFIELPDHRALCARDAKTAVLREEQGLVIARDVRDGMDKLFSRFTTFPETNVAFRLVDRVHLLDLFKLAGNDYHCPNVWGITQPRTNRDRVEYEISLMSGLPLSWFQATTAHEYAHTWVGEHLSLARRAGLSRDAEEGFCELVAFLFMDSRGDEAQKALILRNAYTRGQVELFVAAEREYGVNEVLDWMLFGSDDRLSAGDPRRIRRIVQVRSPEPLPPALAASRPNPGPAPDSLRLKAIFWDPKRPRALINNRTFGPHEEASVQVGASNIVVRCLGISADSVHLRVVGSDHEQVLRIK